MTLLLSSPTNVNLLINNIYKCNSVTPDEVKDLDSTDISPAIAVLPANPTIYGYIFMFITRYTVTVNSIHILGIAPSM